MASIATVGEAGMPHLVRVPVFAFCVLKALIDLLWDDSGKNCLPF